jgi:general secretion pathway protein G
MKSPAQHRRESGFSLIELLIVVVVIGIIMAITVSSLLHARDKARQGATISDMRNIATAIEAYSLDYSSTPTNDVFATVSIALRPYHNHHIPVSDHWGHTYIYSTDVSSNYSLVSYGKDGLAGDEITPSTRFEFDRDIVIANGEFPGLP